MTTAETGSIMQKNVLPLIDVARFQLDQRLPAEHIEHFSPETVVAMRTILSVGRALRGIDVQHGVEMKSEGILNLVTQWDKTSGDIIRRELASSFPTDPILSEEVAQQPDNLLAQPRLWVVDELDGTFNASRGISYFAIAIGLVENGKPKCGAVYSPPLDQLFYGEIGFGSFLDGEKINVRKTAVLHASSIITNPTYKASDLHHHLDLLRVTNSPRVNVCGSSVMLLSEVAAGRHDLGFALELKPWDRAAVEPILIESGAEIRGVDGRTDTTILDSDIVVGSKDLVDQFIPLARPLLKEWGFAPKKSL